MGQSRVSKEVLEANRRAAVAFMVGRATPISERLVRADWRVIRDQIKQDYKAEIIKQLKGGKTGHEPTKEDGELS